jgi:conjugal transfer pilus assembly protein TraF
MVTRIRLALIAIAVLAFAFGALAAEGNGTATTAAVESDPEPAGDYWRRNQEGWFWYRDPPEATARPKAPPAPPARARELVDFEAMQAELENRKRIAVMNPTDANLLAYMRYQRMVMDKSERFALGWQRLVWTTPDLDYGLTGRPTNAAAVAAYDERQRERQAQLVRSLAATHGLLFLFRSDCAYCHRFAPILKRFEQEFNFTVLAVSLDGGTLPEYPNAQPDNGTAARLNASMVPALYLTAPSTRDIRPVGFGVMAMTELVERIAALAESPHALSFP